MSASPPAAPVAPRRPGRLILANLLLSWAFLPLLVPPHRVYTFRELMEALLWQGMGLIGWPLALLGGGAVFLSQGRASDAVSLLFVLIYPILLALLALVLISKRELRWAEAVLHLLIPVSFALVWNGVLNGYDFMRG